MTTFHRGSLVLAGILICSVLPSFAASSTDSLVGYWKFDETTTDSCPGGEDACDSSGDGRHGTFQGSPTISTTLPPGIGFANTRSLSFDGTDDYLSLGDLSEAEDHIFTYSLWARFPTITSNDYFFSEGNTTNGNSVVALYHPSATQVGVFYRIDDGTFVASNSDLRTTVAVDTWYHFAVVGNGALEP